MSDSTSTKIVFMGTPPFVAPVLAALHATFDVVGVFTQPPRPAGRGHKLKPSPIHTHAEALGLPVFTPPKLKDEGFDQLVALKPDFICVAAYGLILPQRVLDLAPCINIHPSALPRWRGAAPVHHTILAGDKTTDICIMAMEKSLDTGAVYARAADIPVDLNETALELLDRLFIQSAPMLVDVIQCWPIAPIAQVGEPTYADKFGAEDRPIDWSQSAEQIHNKVRAFNPMPGATAEYGDTTLKILTTRVVEGAGQPGEIIAIADETITVACGAGALAIHQLQRPGKQQQAASEFIKGFPLTVGKKFS